MSYEIVYDRQFLKVQLPSCDEPWILPLTLHGSNNTSEGRWKGQKGPERRARNWSAMYFNGENEIPLVATVTIMEKIESWCGGEYQEHFVRNGKNVDDEGLRRYFKNGIKEAKTLEELNALSKYPIRLRCYLSVWGEGMSHKLENDCYARNSDELLKFLLNSKVRTRNRNKESIYVCVEFENEKPIPHPKEVKKKVEKDYGSEYWLIRNLLYTYQTVYVRQLTARSLKYTENIDTARKFESEKAAQKWLDTMVKPKGFDKRALDALIPEKVKK